MFRHYSIACVCSMHTTPCSVAIAAKQVPSLYGAVAVTTSECACEAARLQCCSCLSGQELCKQCNLLEDSGMCARLDHTTISGVRVCINV